MTKRHIGIQILAVVLFSATVLAGGFDREDMRIKQALRTAAKDIGWADQIETYESAGCVAYLLMDDAGMLSICAYPFASTARTESKSLNMGTPGTFHALPSWNIKDPEGAASTFTWQGKRFIFSAATADWQLKKAAEALFASLVAEGLLPGVKAKLKVDTVMIVPPPKKPKKSPKPKLKPKPQPELAPKKAAMLRTEGDVVFVGLKKGKNALTVTISCRQLEDGTILHGQLKTAHSEHILQTVPAIAPDEGTVELRFPAPFLGWQSGHYVVGIRIKDEIVAKGTVTLP